MPNSNPPLEQAVPILEATTRPCAFCHTEEHPALYARRVASSVPVSPTDRPFRCLLNPGQAHGPDGHPITETDCTAERQVACQARRRQKFARLCGPLTTPL